MSAVVDGGDPSDLSPREAANEWLSKRKLDLADSTHGEYRQRLFRFVKWCESVNHETMGDLTPWNISQYDTYRRESDPSKVYLNKDYGTLADWLEWAESVGITERELAAALDAPALSKRDEVNTERLRADVAENIIAAFRGDESMCGTKWHVVLELAWYTGARIGAIRGLDLTDVDVERGRLRFIHRPEMDTPLKNDEEGERVVGVPPSVAETLRTYVRRHRHDVFDDYSRRPFITVEDGRPHANSLSRWMRYATLPCHGMECPHGEQPDACEWRDYRDAKGCPSSLTPHRVRTGALTWMLNNPNIPDERVSERVNTSLPVLYKHYDHQSAEEEFRERRADYVPFIEFEQHRDESNESDKSHEENQ